MKPPYSAVATANYFLEATRLEGKGLTQMQLQKLVYIAHGWHLAVKGSPLVSEPVQAWPFGPVLPSLYKAASAYGSSEIFLPLYIANGYNISQASIPIEDTETRRFLKRIWEDYKRYTAVELMALTHRPGTPWSEAWLRSGGGTQRGEIISNDAIKKHYMHLLSERTSLWIQ